METFHIFALSVVQGITESLPVSSSAHLALFPVFLGIESQNPFLDVAVHLGTGAAFMIYFFKYVISLIKGFFHLVLRRKTEESVFWIKMFLGTLPTVLVGFLIKKMEWQMGNSWTIGFFSLLFGVLLGISDQSKQESPLKEDTLFQNVSLTQFFILGCLQAIAFFPGVSRLGVCLMGARFMGFRRRESAILSFVMGIPVTLGASVLYGSKILSMGQDLIAPLMVSGILCLLGIGLFLTWLKRHSLTWIMVYRVILGIILLSYSFFKP